MDGLIINTGGGSGGGSLNLHVVGGTSQPTSPKENTVWVDTDTEIEGWAFSATKPYRKSKNKNLLVYPFVDTTKTSNGITWTDNGDGTVTANGTATANSFFMYAGSVIDSGLLELEPGTYTFSGCPARNPGNANYWITIVDNETGTVFDRDRGESVSFTLTKTTYVRGNLIVAAGATVSNIVFKPQLEKGSAATSFIKGDATGMAWFKTGTSASAAMNIDKKNTVMLYPTNCQQYINGAWVGKTAKTYLNSKWVDWMVYLYNLGDECTSITGGWDDYLDNAGYSITKGADYLKIKGVDNQYSGTGSTTNAIDLTKYSTLHAIVKRTSSGTCNIGISAKRNASASDLTAKKAVTTTAYNEVTLDISGYNSAYYIVLTVDATDELYIQKIWLE